MPWRAVTARARASVPGRAAELGRDGAARCAMDPNGGRGASGWAGAAGAAVRRVRPRRDRHLGGRDNLQCGRENRNPARPITALAGFAIHSTWRIGDHHLIAPGFIVSKVGFTVADRAAHQQGNNTRTRKGENPYGEAFGGKILADGVGDRSPSDPGATTGYESDGQLSRLCLA